MFSQATAHGGLVTLHQLARPNGLVIGAARASMLLGVVAFGIAAACSGRPAYCGAIGGQSAGSVTSRIGDPAR
jgi:hypothetical protein